MTVHAERQPQLDILYNITILLKDVKYVCRQALYKDAYITLFSLCGIIGCFANWCFVAKIYQ